MLTKRWAVALAAMLLLANAAVLARAADEKPEQKPIDKTLVGTLKDVTNVGVDLYNNGDHAGCYHTFKALLLTVKPMIDHRPDLQKHIDTGIAAADTQPIMWQRARALRSTLDDVRKSLASGKPLDLPPGDKKPDDKKPDDKKPDDKKPEPPKPVTLWEKLGGKDKVEKIVDDFLTAAAKDPIASRNGKLAPTAEMLPEAKKHLVAFISSVTKGPIEYDGKSMKEAHKGLDITKEEFDADAKHFKAALDKNGVKPEDRDALMKIMAGFEKDIVVEKKPEPPKAMTLWEKLGGQEAVAKIVGEWFAAASKDPKVNVTRDGKYKLDDKAVEELLKSAVAWVSSKTGGPLKYTGKNMKEAHKGMGITNAEFDAVMTHLKEVLAENKVKKEDADALVKIVEATRSDIVEAKKPDDKKPDDKKPDDKKPDDKKPDDKKPDDKKPDDKKPTDKKDEPKKDEPKKDDKP